MHEKPFIQSLWLVDAVEKDRDTGKVNLGGLFDEITIEDPGRAFTHEAYLFCGIRNIHQKVTLNVRYTDLHDESILLDRSVSVSNDDPLTTLDFCLIIPRIPVPHEGVYLWELVWENEPVASSRLTA